LQLDRSDPQLDEFARQLAHDAGVPYAMVNLFTGGEQHFLGLWTPDGHGTLPAVGRHMPLGHGFCPEVVARRTALVLPDVYAHPRFAGNAVVDLINIRTYTGAPLIHDSGTVLGTVCFVGPQALPRETGQASLALIKDRRDQVMDYIRHRAGHQPPQI
jgi:GAF domain-containing protein